MLRLKYEMLKYIFNQTILSKSKLDSKTFLFLYNNFMKLSTITSYSIFMGNLYFGYKKYQMNTKFESIETKHFIPLFNIMIFSCMKAFMYVFSFIFVIPYFFVMYDLNYNSIRRDYHLIPGKKYYKTLCN